MITNRNPYWLLLLFVALPSLSLRSQSNTIMIEYVSEIYSSKSINGKNYLFGSIATPVSNPMLTVKGSTYPLDCSKPLFLVVDDSLNLIEHKCFYDTSGSNTGFHKGMGIPNAKIDIEKNIHSEKLFITGSVGGTVIFGTDTLYPATPSGIDVIFLAKLDTNLNPIWAISNDFHNDWFSPEIGVKEMAVDGRGRVWLSVEVDQFNSIAFGNDTVYGVGTVVFDTSGVPVPAYYNDPEISDYEFIHMKRVDESRMLLLKEDLSVFTQFIYMMDTDADTIIWKKANYDNIMKTTVDTANNCYYGISYNGILYKYDMMGTRVWYSIYNLNAKPRFLSLTETGDRVFVAAVAQNTMNTIYIIDSSGVLVDSTIWGISKDFGNSQDIYFQSFHINNDFLKIACKSYHLDTLLFGNDTLTPSTNYAAVLSFININQILTSLPQVPELDKATEVSLEIFPNPNKGSFQMKNPEKVESVQLYNSLGQFVKGLEIDNGLINIEEDAGIYFIKVRYKDGNVAFGKVVKQ